MLKIRFSRAWLVVDALYSALRTKPAGTSRASAAASASLPKSSRARARPTIAMFFRLLSPSVVASVMASVNWASAIVHTSALVSFGPLSIVMSHMVSPRIRYAYAAVRASLGEHALPVRHLGVGEARRALEHVVELEARLLHGRVEAHRRCGSAGAAAARALDLDDAAPFPRVTVDEVVGYPVLACQHTDRGNVVVVRALERLQRGCLERRHEAGSASASTGTLAGLSTASSRSHAVVVTIVAVTRAAVSRRRSPARRSCLAMNGIVRSLGQKVRRRDVEKLAVGGRIVWKPFDRSPTARISGSHTCWSAMST